MATTPNRPSLEPGTLFSQIGADVYSPSGEGWFLAQLNDRAVTFGKQYGEPEDSAVVNAVIFQVKGFDSDAEFLSHIEAQRERQDDKRRFKVLELSNEQVSFKSTVCLKYSTLSEDHKKQGINSSYFQYLKTSGYVCRHPSNKEIAFQMEVSHRSSEKGFPSELLLLGEMFHANIQFTADGIREPLNKL
ncbi:MAG: hypothetical protein L3J28_03385 [Candidatus Polarisedimenticolaceae bacterium]|nr:hypothetical protein [Candidatus Polarisedimenticolaceae bacterium]